LPYITIKERLKYESAIRRIISSLPHDQRVDGHINYIFTRILKEVYTPGYFNYNRAIGVLECCKLELYRHVVGPYEEAKLKERGDV